MGINLREHVLVVRGSSVHSCSLDEYGRLWAPRIATWETRIAI